MTLGTLLGWALGSVVGKLVEIVVGVALMLVGATTLYEHLTVVCPCAPIAGMFAIVVYLPAQIGYHSARSGYLRPHPGHNLTRPEQ